MATVATVYTIAPFVRTPQQIVNPEESTPEKEIKRPRPQCKRLWASLVKEPQQVIEEAFDEALHRDPGINLCKSGQPWVELSIPGDERSMFDGCPDLHTFGESPQRQKRWVALVDGNETQLRLLKKLARKHNIHLTIVLDIIHVIEYLWKAAFVFHSPASKQAEDWVSVRLLRLLEGGSSLIASGMRRSATKSLFSQEKRQPVDKCANYLLNHTAYLQYAHYLAVGLPIATGVIEGACRYLVKDRMDITGARWSLMGAEAVLRLRALHVSGDFHDYWRFHLERSLGRNHRMLYKTGIPLMRSVASASCSTPPSLSFVV